MNEGEETLVINLPKEEINILQGCTYAIMYLKNSLPTLDGPDKHEQLRRRKKLPEVILQLPGYYLAPAASSPVTEVIIKANGKIAGHISKAAT